MPNQRALSSSGGQSVGGVSGRAGAKAGGSDPSANDSFACRDGRRHPGFQEGGSLRGASSERKPRSVRFGCGGSSVAIERADDSGCPKVAEEGNAVGMRAQSACTHHGHERSSHVNRGRVLRSVLRPVHVNPHYAPRGNSRRWGVSAGITVGQTHASGRNHHWGRHGRTERGSPRITALAREAA